MKKTLLLHVCLVFLCFSNFGNAQEGKVKKATESFDEFSYVDARGLYLRLAEKGVKTQEVFRKLGDSYYFTAEYRDAATWYEKLFSDEVTDKDSQEIDAEYYFRYAQSLKSLGLYDRANAQMEKFYSLRANDSRAKRFKKDRNYLAEIEKNSGRYSVSTVFFNSELQDFGPSFYEDQLVFSSNRENVTGNLTHNWNDQPFLDLFLVSNPQDSVPSVDGFTNQLNTKYHESSSVFTKNGSVVYFTRNNYSKKKRLRKDDAGTTKLKLFRSVRTDDEWSTPEELPFNSDEFSTAHPALSPDESILYFASDRPGTKGLSDLWKVAILDDGGFGEPVNLGGVINTEGRETFPYVTSSNELFYASDGHSGLGGLDIFISTINDGTISETANVGKPLNSSKDDFGLILNDQSGLGYFASNRDGGLGNDDIYAVKREIAPPCYQAIAGITRDSDTNEIIPGATVELRNIENDVLATQTSNAQGKFNFNSEYPCETPYVIRASKEKYEMGEASVTTGSEPDGVANRDILLQPKLRLQVGDDLAKTLNLNPIYFDFDKAYIRPDAALELEKVIAVMKEYPTLKIDVRSHTDSRGRDAYNLDLSQRRNTSTKNYIINQGVISGSRISGRGYGETSPVNQCSNGVKCSEEEHQLNRRSEFIIIER
jgi:outer membrane protein OmpA-like peptidoglycan-associated protein